MADTPSDSRESPPAPGRQGRRRATVFFNHDGMKLRRNATGSLHACITRQSQDFGPADLKKLKVLLRTDLRGNAKAFWEALKILVVKTYGTTEAAWTENACPQDESMSLEQFHGLCLAVGLCINPSTIRILFETRLREGEMFWTLQDFYDALVLATIDKVRGRLQEYNRTQAAIRSHINGFLQHLALRTGETNQRRAVTRFQRKLNVSFCQDVWKVLQRWVLRRLASQGDNANDITCEEFVKVMASTNRIIDYELDFIRQIFDHVDRSSDKAYRGRVTTSDLAVALALLGTDSSRYEKAWFLFSVFDSDSDGCLTCEQILRMYCCAAIHGNIARNDKPMYDADIALGDELSLAKARRLYDFTVTLLSLSVDDFYSFQEWWAVLEGNEMLQEELLPGCSRIMWVLKPPRPASPERSLGDAKGNWAKLRSASKQRGGAVRRSRGAFSSSVPLLNNILEGQPLVARSGSNRAPGHGPARHDFRAAEHFRVQSAIRFRHAVRGEWDRIDALRAAPTMTTMTQRTNSKLPPLPSGGAASASSSRGFLGANSGDQDGRETAGSRSITPWKATAVWVDALGSFRNRQKGGNWNRVHGETLTNWSKAGFRPLTADSGRRPSLPALGQSQSLPELGRSDSRRGRRPRPRQSKRPSVVAQGSSEIHLGVASSSTAHQLQQRTSKVIANVAQQAKSALESMPRHTEQFGDVAMDRFRCLSTVGATFDSPGDGGSQQTLPYECKVCGVWHDSGAFCGVVDD